MNLVHAQVGKALSQPARPAHFSPLSLGSRAQAEMDSHVAVRAVTGTAAHFIHKNASGRLHSNSSTDAVAIRFRAYGADRDPVVRRPNLVDQQTWTIVHIADDCRNLLLVHRISKPQTTHATISPNSRPRP